MEKEAHRSVSLDLLEALAVEHMIPKPFKFVVLTASSSTHVSWADKAKSHCASQARGEPGGKRDIGVELPNSLGHFFFQALFSNQVRTVGHGLAHMATGHHGHPKKSMLVPPAAVSVSKTLERCVAPKWRRKCATLSFLSGTCLSHLGKTKMPITWHEILPSCDLLRPLTALMGWAHLQVTSAFLRAPFRRPSVTVRASCLKAQGSGSKLQQHQWDQTTGPQV